MNPRHVRIFRTRDLSRRRRVRRRLPFFDLVRALLLDALHRYRLVRRVRRETWIRGRRRVRVGVADERIVHDVRSVPHSIENRVWLIDEVDLEPDEIRDFLRVPADGDAGEIQKIS